MHKDQQAYATVLPEVASAPAPSVAFDERGAVLSPVRFEHVDRCVRCHRPVRLFTDGGEIHAGLRVSGSGKTVRWYQNLRPAKRPVVPSSCPHCGLDRVFYADAFAREPIPAGRAVSSALNNVWTTLRAQYPNLASRADSAAGLSQRPRPRQTGRREEYFARAERYAAGLAGECEACRWPCPEHGVTACRLCHTHPGECGYGACTAPEQLVAVDYWPDSGTVAQRRTLCARHMRWWRHECLKGVDRTIQCLGQDTGHVPVVVVSRTGAGEAEDTLVGARMVLRQLREEAEYARLCVEVLSASLCDADLDAATVSEVVHMGEATHQMVTAAGSALAGLDARHSGLEEAVNTTAHPAHTAFYRRSGATEGVKQR